MVVTQFQQGHVRRSIQDAGRLSKLLGQDNFAFNVIDASIMYLFSFQGHYFI